MLQDEFSLREIINAIWNGKRVIVMVMIITMGLGGIYSFFVMSPTYEAKAVVIVNNNTDPKLGVVIQDLTPFAEQIKSDYIINKIVKNINTKPQGDKAEKNFESINVESVKDSKLIRVTVKGKDAKYIANMTNSLANELNSLVETSTKLSLIVTNKKRLIEVEEQLKLTQSEIDQIREQIKITPEKIKTQKSLADDPYLHSIARDTSAGNKELGSLQMTSEELNPVYISLQNKLAENTVLLSKLIADKNNGENLIKENQKYVDELQKSMQTLSFNTESISQSTNTSNAVLITPAIVPEDPVGPRKSLIVAVAGVLGGVISLLIIFLREYWRRSGGSLNEG